MLGQIFALREKFEKEEYFDSLRKFKEGRLGWEEKPAGGGKAPCAVAETLLEAVVMSAKVVCTTPQICHPKNIYGRYNAQKAKGVVLDDAGAMHAADALPIWGWGCRPCLLAGDPQRVFVRAHNQTRNGRCMNAFSQYGRVSVLERMEKIGWPCFVDL